MYECLENQTRHPSVLVVHPVDDEVLVSCQHGQEASLRSALERVQRDADDQAESAHLDEEAVDDEQHPEVAEAHEGIPLVDVGKRYVGHGHVEELAQGLPAVLELEVEQLLLGHALAHHGVVVPVQGGHLLVGLSARVGADPAAVGIAQASSVHVAHPVGHGVQHEVVEAVQPPVDKRAAEAVHPRVQVALHQDHFSLGVACDDLLAKDGREIRDGAVTSDEAVPLAAAPGQQRIVLGDVEGALAAAGLAQGGEAAPGGVAPGEVLGAVGELEGVVHGSDAEDLESFGKRGGAGAREAGAENAVAVGEVLGRLVGGGVGVGGFGEGGLGDGGRFGNGGGLRHGGGGGRDGVEREGGIRELKR